METQKQTAVETLTKADELLVHRRGLGLTFRKMRLEAGLTLRGASNKLAELGVNVSYSRLAMFERGGVTRSGGFTEASRPFDTTLHIDILSKLEEVYGIPPEKREENRSAWYGYLTEEMTKQARYVDLGGRVLSDEEGLRRALGLAETQLELCKRQLEKEKAVNAVLSQTIENLQQLVTRPAGPPVLGLGARSTFVPPTGKIEKVLGKKK
jgi:hypothetical protein